MKAILALILVAGAAAGGWWVYSNEHRAPGPTAVVVVMYDTTHSTNAQGIRSDYLAATKTVLNSLGHGELLVVGTVTSSSLSAARFEVEDIFPAYDPLQTNLLTHKQALATERQKALAAVSHLLSAPVGYPGTDLVGALNDAARVFASYPQTKTRDLILMSDMMGTTPVNLYTTNLSARSIRRMIASQRAANSLPKLHGARWYVVGAGNSTGHSARDPRILAVRAYWMAYARACGGGLTVARYGGPLVRFP